MNFHTKGQGLSLNAIIVALLALIVLVVLTVLFITRTTEVDVKAQQAADAELIAKRITYGKCSPSASDEVSFKTELAAATDDTGRAVAREKFDERIRTCKALSEKSVCESATCTWKG
ncbi:hypothetical protein HY496_01425 [Candidatus Woesearchaeota archaeon]|nr:hypothetical protein [Candidatus Woesearchaeota archaeon]